MSYQAYNLRLRKKETIQNPHFEAVQTKRGQRYLVKGTGSDGTKLNRFISRQEYQMNQGRQGTAGRLSPSRNLTLSPVRSPTRNLSRSPVRRPASPMNVNMNLNKSPRSLSRPVLNRPASPLNRPVLNRPASPLNRTVLNRPASPLNNLGSPLNRPVLNRPASPLNKLASSLGVNGSLTPNGSMNMSPLRNQSLAPLRPLSPLPIQNLPQLSQLQSLSSQRPQISPQQYRNDIM